jgi:hypothetical protein
LLARQRDLPERKVNLPAGGLKKQNQKPPSGGFLVYKRQKSAPAYSERFQQYLDRRLLLATCLTEVRSFA